MFGTKKRVEIFKKKDRATWEEMKKALSAEGGVPFKSGHYFQDTVSNGGCGAKLDPRNFGEGGKIDREIYWIRVLESDVEKAKDILLKNGLTPYVDESILLDASVRVANKQDEFFK